MGPVQIYSWFVFLNFITVMSEGLTAHYMQMQAGELPPPHPQFAFIKIYFECGLRGAKRVGNRKGAV